MASSHSFIKSTMVLYVLSKLSIIYRQILWANLRIAPEKSAAIEVYYKKHESTYLLQVKVNSTHAKRHLYSLQHQLQIRFRPLGIFDSGISLHPVAAEWWICATYAVRRYSITIYRRLSTTLYSGTTFHAKSVRFNHSARFVINASYSKSCVYSLANAVSRRATPLSPLNSVCTHDWRCIAPIINRDTLGWQATPLIYSESDT